MKLLLTLLLSLSILGTYPASAPSQTTHSLLVNHSSAAIAPAPSAWRRTEQGWERAGTWPKPRPPVNRWHQLHPAVVAVLISLISVGALVAAEPNPLTTTRRSPAQPANASATRTRSSMFPARQQSRKASVP